MSSKTIKITCQTKDSIPVDELEQFQGNLKTLNDKQAAKIEASIVRYGFTFPVFVWKSKEGVNNIIDGHQRAFVVKKMIADGGFTLEGAKIPVVFIDAKNIKEAKAKVLLAASRYGRIDDTGLHDFLADAEIDIEDISDAIDLPEIRLDGDFEPNYGDLDKELTDHDPLNDAIIKIVVPKQYEDDVRAWLSNGEGDKESQLGKGVLKRCGLL